MATVLDLRHLRLVLAIAETGSMRRAADRLHVSQPALSRQLSSVEQQLGTQLFDRNSRMRLTAAGQELLGTARVVLSHVEATERQLGGIARGEVGTLRLSTECHTCYGWMPSRMARFRKLFPGVALQVVVEATPNPLTWLLDGRLDLAIVSSEPRLPNIKLTPLFSDELVAIVAPSHPWTKRKFVTARDFAGEHLYVYNAPLEANRIFKRVLQPAGVRPCHVTYLPLTEATLEMVKVGLGVAVLAHWAVASEVAAGRLAEIRISARGFRRNWCAARLNAPCEPAYLAKFIELLGNAPFGSLSRKRVDS